MRKLQCMLAGLAVFAVAFSLTAGGAAIAPKKLVGVWKVTKGEGAPPGASVEFTADNKFVVRFSINGKDAVLEGKYKVAGDKLTTEMNLGGQTKSEVDTIQKLDDKTLRLKDEKGKVQEFERAK